MRGRRGLAGWVCTIGVLACSASALALSGSPIGVSATFQPWASSFVSPATGFALGGIGCRFGVSGAQQPCKPVMVATSDGGASWRRLAAPPALLEWALLTSGGPDVRAVTFADSRDGWLYSPSLWATHDGGAHWTRVLPPKVVVTSVVAGGGYAYAAVGDELGLGAQSPTLLRSPVGRNDWKAVDGLPGSLATGDGGWLLAAAGGTVWAGIVPSPTSVADPVLWRSVDGGLWQRLGNPCGGRSLASLSAGSASELVMLCAGRGLEIVTSSDGGARLHSLAAPADDELASFAAAPPNTNKIIVFASPLRSDGSLGGAPAAEAGSWLDQTADRGGTWSRTHYNDRGAGWADLQFSSPTVGSVIHGYPGASVDQLMRTTDAGATFNPVRF